MTTEAEIALGNAAQVAAECQSAGSITLCVCVGGAGGFLPPSLWRGCLPPLGCERTDFCCFTSPVCGNMYGSPRTLTYPEQMSTLLKTGGKVLKRGSNSFPFSCLLQCQQTLGSDCLAAPSPRRGPSRCHHTRLRSGPVQSGGIRVMLSARTGWTGGLARGQIRFFRFFCIFSFSWVNT